MLTSFFFRRDEQTKTKNISSDEINENKRKNLTHCWAYCKQNLSVITKYKRTKGVLLVIQNWGNINLTFTFQSTSCTSWRRLVWRLGWEYISDYIRRPSIEWDVVINMSDQIAMSNMQHIKRGATAGGLMWDEEFAKPNKYGASNKTSALWKKYEYYKIWNKYVNHHVEQLSFRCLRIFSELSLTNYSKFIKACQKHLKNTFCHKDVHM